MGKDFKDKFEEMGLKYNNAAYYYSDRFSQIVYKELISKDSQSEVHLLGIYTRVNEKTPWSFAGIVSYLYNFVGNDRVVGSIEDSINRTGTPVYNEYIQLNSKMTLMCADVVIRNSNNVPNVGDVYPVVNIWNSYDGTKMAEVSFGLTLMNQAGLRHAMHLRNTLGCYKQIHIQNAKTKLSYAIGNYVDVVQNNILEFITTNMENRISERDLLASLDLIEKIGKRKREEVSAYLTELAQGQRPITSWDLFLAITRFSTVENNLNAKVLLENIVERIMVVPTKMLEALKTINQEIKKAA